MLFGAIVCSLSCASAATSYAWYDTQHIFVGSGKDNNNHTGTYGSSGKDYDNTAEGKDIVWTSGGSGIEKIYGGCIEGADPEVSGNHVTLKERKDPLWGVMGGYGYASSGTANVHDNYVTAKGVTFDYKTEYGGAPSISGGYSTQNAYSNHVALTNVTFAGNAMADINGGSTSGGGASSAVLKVSNNEVSMKDTVFGSKDSPVGATIHGGAAEFTGYYAEGLTGTVTAEGNTVELENVSVFSNYDTEPERSAVYGGYAAVLSTYSAKDTIGQAEAKGNKLYIYGGSIQDRIYGGYSCVAVSTDPMAGEASIDAEKSTASSSSNLVSLNPDEKGASPVFNDTYTVIWGGYAEVAGVLQESAGNTLEFHNVKGMSAANIKNFDKLVFELPAMKSGETVLKLTGTVVTGVKQKNDDVEEVVPTVTGTETTNLSKARVEVTVGNLTGSNGTFSAGDKVYLLTNENGIETAGIDLSKEVAASTGISYDYKLKVKTDGVKDGRPTSLVLVLAEDTGSGSGSGQDNSKTFRQETKAIAEGAAAGLALVNEAANAGIELARAFSMQAGSIAPFIHVQGSSVTHETGSNVHLNAVSLLAGIGTGLDTGFGNLSVGAFFEYGKGSYTTNNSFSYRSDVNGDGDAWYMGGGILAKMDFVPTGPGHFYVEGSAHMGQLHNEYDSSDLRDAGGRIASFDMDSPYYSLHGGLGYVWNITEDHDVDVYGNYIWTRVQGTDDTLTTGDKFEFDDMDSSRVRFGARYTYKGSERFRPYAGVAWEHEFAGSCESTAYAHPVAAPSFEGDTGIGELGITMTPSKDLPLSVSLGVQGYVGQKQGVSGNCMVKYEF